MNTKLRFLFTNEDFGHYFDDGTQALHMIRRIIRGEFIYQKHFDVGTIGGSANEKTEYSEIPRLYSTYKYVYPIDGGTYGTIFDIINALSLKSNEQTPEQSN